MDSDQDAALDPRDDNTRYADAAQRALRATEPPHQPFDRYLSHNARFTACRNCLGPYPCKYSGLAEIAAGKGES